MPRVLILSRQNDGATIHWVRRTRNLQRILQNFGIDADTMRTADIPTLSGSGYAGRKNRIVDWQNTGYYQAIIHCENRLSSDTNGASGEYDPYNWSKTSEGVTLPIAYFGAPNKQMWIDSRLPSDLGIVAFNDADANTYYQILTDFESENPRGRRLGTRLVFNNGKKAWARVTNYIFGSGTNKPAFFLFDPFAQTSNVEPVLQLDWTEIGVTKPQPQAGDVVAGVRYYNKYFLPALSYVGRGSPDDFQVTKLNGYAGSGIFNLWLVLWFLEQVGILPVWKMPITYDIDHPLPGVASAAHRTELTQAQIDQIELQTMTWLYEKAKSWNMPVRCGVTTGVWRSSSYHSGRRTSSLYSEQLHQLLVRAHREGVFPCCWHDHTYPNGRNDGASYTRHTGGQYGLGNPVNDVIKAYNPTTGRYEWQGSGTQIWSSAEASKTGADAHLTNRRQYRMHWEGSKIEMTSQLGFPDEYCGKERYLNQAGNEYGNPGFLDFLLEETPVRALRVNDSTLSQYGLPQWHKGRDFRTLRYKGELEIFLTAGMDGGMRGLWNPGSGADINNSDLNQWDNLGSLEGDTNRDRRIRAKFLAYTVDLVLTQILYQGAVPYNHPDFCHSASATAPLSDYNETGNWNGLLECVKAVYEELCFGLLGNWFKPARSIWEIVEWRARLRT